MKRLIIYATTLFLGLFLVLSSTEDATAQQAKKIILAGYKHTPPVQTSGSGSSTIELNGDTLTVKGKFKNLTGNYSGAYIMVSLRGQGGNQLYRLKTTLDENDKTSGTFVGKENQFVLSPAQKKLLQKGDLYINVSSFENRKGELRGNIGPLGK